MDPSKPKLQQLRRVLSRNFDSSHPFWGKLAEQFASFDGRRTLLQVKEGEYRAVIGAHAEGRQLVITVARFEIRTERMGTRQAGLNPAFAHFVSAVLENTDGILSRAPSQFTSVRFDGDKVMNPGLVTILESVGFTRKPGPGGSDALVGLQLVVPLNN